jgi:hypothetical protein
MSRTWFVLSWIALSAGVVFAQQANKQSPQQPGEPPAISTEPPPTLAGPAYTPPAPVYPVAQPLYGYGQHHSSTAAEGALNGMGNVISAQGNYNLATSAAAVNMTQAQQNAIQNQMTYTNTYFQMRETNKAYREANRKPRPTEEQMARWARDAAPKPPSPGEVNSVSGQVNWPTVLQDESFAKERTTVDELSAKKATHGSLSLSDQMTARKTIESMFAHLKSHIREIPTQDYLASRNFLRSMIYSLAHSDLS